jgi:hypothetical protein
VLFCLSISASHYSAGEALRFFGLEIDKCEMPLSSWSSYSSAAVRASLNKLSPFGTGK